MTKLAQFLFSLLGVAASIAISCGAEDSRIPFNKVGGEDTIIGKWAVVGPFSVDPGRAFATEVSELVGIENATSSAGFDDVFAKQASDRPDFRTVLSADREYYDFQKIFEQVRTRHSETVFALAACIIDVPAEGDYWMLHASADGSQIFVNGTLVHTSDRKRGLYPYDDIFPVKLGHGRNYVCVKVPRTGVGWGMTTRLVSSWKRAIEIAMQSQGIYQALILERLVYQENEQLDVSARRLPPADKLELRLYDLDGVPLRSIQIRPNGNAWETEPLAGLKTGLYRLGLRLGEAEYSEDILVGNIFEYAGGMLSQEADDLFRGEDLVHWRVLRRRLSHLLKFEHRPSSQLDWNWNRKTIHVLRQLELARRMQGDASDRFARLKGLGFRGFRSRIDDQIQQVRLFVPETAGDRKLRLCVLLPTVVSANRPFIESAFAAAHVEAERIAYIANKHGIAVLWSGYRNAPSGLPSETAHLAEAVDFMQRTYNIDENGIFLAGACSGGALAVRGILEEPNRYAGAALLNPVFGLKSPPVSSRVLRRHSDYQAVRSNSSRTDEFFAMRPAKVEIFHDGAEPGHGVLEESERFMARATRSGYPARLNLVEQSVSQHMQAWEEMFAWIAETTSARRAVEGAPAAHSPRAVDLFADRVVFVVGTEGSDKDQAACRRMMENISALWRRIYFGNCIIATDAEIMAMAELPRSLVLLGNAETNRIWQKFAERLQVRLAQLSIKNLEPGLSYCVLVPGEPNLLFYGADSIDTFDAYDLNLLQDAWFSALVFRKRGRTIEQLEIRF